MQKSSRRPLPDESDVSALAPDVNKASIVEVHELRSFGRRRGRRLSARQQSLLDSFLPQLEVDLAEASPQSLEALFPLKISEVRLEVGFGGGEHLVWQARNNPDVGFIGCEPYLDGLVKALIAIEEHGLQNVRLFADDVRPLLRWLPEASLQRVYILFPDPWPKKRHAKRRLVSPGLLNLLAKVMVPQAELRIATDIGDYARTALLSIRTSGAFTWQAEGPQDWRERGADWPQTRYEAKARGQGRRCYFLRFLRNSRL